MGDYDRRREERWRRHVDRRADSRDRPLKEQSSWTRVARRLGLKVESVRGHRVVMQGRLAGCAIDVIREPSGGGFMWTVIVARSGVDESIVLTKETAVTRAKKIIGGDDIQVGELGFDFLVHASGDAGRVLAALDHPGRRAVYGLIERGARVEKGAFTIVRRTNADNAAPEHLRRDLEYGAKLLRRLAGNGSKVRARLINNARKETNTDVRAANLDQLRKRHPEDIGRMDWARADDEPRPIAWRMALFRRDTDVSELYRWIDDDDLATNARLEFIARLERMFPDPEAISAVEKQLHGPLSGRAIRILLKRVEHHAVLRELRTPSLFALMNAASKSGRIRLAQSLGSIGRLDAVEVLMPYTTGLFVPRELKDAARHAVAAIQKLSDRNGGRLSMVDGDGGQLSVAGEAGALSIDFRERDGPG